MSPSQPSQRVLLAPVESSCRALRLVIQDGNRTVQLPLPCSHAGLAGRGSRHDARTVFQRREIGLYTSESDSVTVYLQPSFSAITSTARHHHHLYLIKYQGVVVPSSVIKYQGDLVCCNTICCSACDN